MTNPLKTEPAAAAGLVPSIVALAVSFGLEITAEQLAGIVSVVTLLLGFWVRSRVSPVTKPQDPPAARPPHDPPRSPSNPPLMAAVFALLVVACAEGLPQPRGPGECDEVRVDAITAECGMRRARECPGMSEDADCSPVDAECDRLLDQECQTP